MPIYEFRCKECSQKFEELLYPLQVKKMKNKGTSPLCPACCSNKTERVMSVSNFRIKGYNEANGYSSGDVK